MVSARRGSPEKKSVSPRYGSVRRPINLIKGTRIRFPDIAEGLRQPPVHSLPAQVRISHLETCLHELLVNW